jgi:hypothetical protein
LPVQKEIFVAIMWSYFVEVEVGGVVSGRWKKGGLVNAVG